MGMDFSEYVALRLFDPAMRALREEVVRLAGLKKDQTALDICCGIGSQVLRFAEEGVLATGIDLNPRMIRLAERRKRKRGLQNASFQMASALALPFHSGRFDCVSISLALHEMAREERNVIVSEMTRVVSQGGRLVFADYIIPAPRTPSAWVSTLFERLAGRENYARFRDYGARGGLPGLLRSSSLHPDGATELGPIAAIVTHKTN
jgi:ubiquinone/menaquinone biosynthesis C-methylase UbiE